MKRISLLVSAGLLSLVAAAGSQVPYTSEFTDGWTVVDANEDGIKWGNVQLDYYGKRDTGCENGAKILTNSNYSSDDWIISPAVTLTAGKKYKIVFWDAHGSWLESFSLHVGRTNTVAGMNAGTTLKEYKKCNSWEANAVSFTPTQSGDYYFGFHAASRSRCSAISLTGFQVKEFNVTPSPERGLRPERSRAAVAAADQGYRQCGVYRWAVRQQGLHLPRRRSGANAHWSCYIMG